MANERASEKPEFYWHNVMERLKGAIGHSVSIRYAKYGSPRRESGVLKAVNDFSNVETRSSGIPFVGSSCAIQQIITEQGIILYQNPLISNNYDIRGIKEVAVVRRFTFGDELPPEDNSLFDNL